MDEESVFTEGKPANDPFAEGEWAGFGDTGADDAPTEPQASPEEAVTPEQAAEGVAYLENDDEPSLAHAEPAPAVADPEPVAAEPEPEPEPEPVELPDPELEDAPEPENAKGQKKRRYYVLRVADLGKFEQVSWLVDKDGHMVPRGTKGARRQTVAMGYSTEDALKIGYAALGAPRDGVKLVAVAALHFQVKTVEPEPVEPIKVKLSIR